MPDENTVLYIDPTHTRKYHYEHRAGDMANLVAALQIVSWKLSQEEIDRDSCLSRLRDAITGIGDAMEKQINRIDQDTTQPSGVAQ